jgi:plastocyanin
MRPVPPSDSTPASVVGAQTDPRCAGGRTQGVRHLSVLVAAGFLLATATACGGSSDGASSSAGPAPAGSASAASATASVTSTEAAPSAPAAPAVVTIKDFAFGVPVAVPAGATVQVTNSDGEAHTVTADSGGAFDVKVGGGGTASFAAPAKPGRYPFHCTYHGNMHGVLVVT